MNLKVSPGLAPVGPKLNNTVLDDDVTSLFFLHDNTKNDITHINANSRVKDILIIIVDCIFKIYLEIFGTILKLSNEMSASKSPGPCISNIAQYPFGFTIGFTA